MSILNRNEVLLEMSKKESFNRKDLKNAIRINDPTYNLENLSSLIESFINKGLVIKEDSNKYCVISKKSFYIYKMSEQLKEIHDILFQKFPDIKFQVWEFSQLNEFLNHLLATTTYIVEVENVFVESFFEVLKEMYSSVLLKPSCDDFFRYAKENTIVIKKLISESPNDLDNPHQIQLEKLLVDIVVDKFTSKLINQSEIHDIYLYCLENYLIDKRKLLRYARRRNSYSLINDILSKIKE